MAQSCEGLITFFVSNGTEFGQEKNYIFPTELNIFFYVTTVQGTDSHIISFNHHKASLIYF